MAKLTRREWYKLALGGLAAATAALPLRGLSDTARRKPDSKFNGVQIGAQSYSFRDRSLDEAIKAMADIGISSCELYNGHFEPADFKPRTAGTTALTREQAREALREWRLTVPLDTFKETRRKFDRAGINLSAITIGFRHDFTDAEIDRCFQMAQATGVRNITSSSVVDMAKRIDEYAKKYKIRVGMHNHSQVDKPNEFSTPDTFARAMQGASEYIGINLDIGHFTAAGFDAVEFLREHHDRIVTLHLKDRKRNQGPNVAWGEGDTPITQVLTLLKQKKWAIPANIEYEYKGADTIAEVTKCLAYCKRALGA